MKVEQHTHRQHAMLLLAATKTETNAIIRRGSKITHILKES